MAEYGGGAASSAPPLNCCFAEQGGNAMRARISPAVAVLLLAAVCATGIAVAADAPADSVDAWTATCREAVAKLGKSLKAELVSAMKDGGPVQALQVCNLQAIPITAKVSAETGIQVCRTSLRVRNPKNMPDVWETQTLEAFTARKADGVAGVDLEAWTIATDSDGHRTFRYMKAIPTVGLCLKCHGSELAPEVSAAVTELYPADLAVGYASGDVRGAFTVHLPLD